MCIPNVTFSSFICFLIDEFEHILLMIHNDWATGKAYVAPLFLDRYSDFKVPFFHYQTLHFCFRSVLQNSIMTR